MGTCAPAAVKAPNNHHRPCHTHTHHTTQHNTNTAPQPHTRTHANTEACHQGQSPWRPRRRVRLCMQTNGAARRGAAHHDVLLRGVTPDQTIATKVDIEKPKPRKNIAKNGRALPRTSQDTVSQCPKAKTRQRHRPTTAKRRKPVTIWRPQVHSRRAAVHIRDILQEEGN